MKQVTSLMGVWVKVALVVLSLFFVLSFAPDVFAIEGGGDAGSGSGQTTGQTPGQTTGQTPGQTTGQTPTANSITNPLESTTITEFLIKIIEILLVFAVPIIVFFILLAGFKFVTAGGNDSEITEAKSALTWAVVGGVIILGANVIIAVVKSIVNTL